MHAKLELIMPPTEDIAAQVAQIMEPWDEQYVDDDGQRGALGWWDFYVIGGRYAGSKIEAQVGEAGLRRFSAALIERGVTVSSVQFGKQELSPASQIPIVDALWREHFPESGVAVCPLFQHSNDQYDNGSTLPGDICTLQAMPAGLTAERVIIAGPSWDGKRIEAIFMAQRDFWNGVGHMRAAWDGTVGAALAEHEQDVARYKAEHRPRRTPGPDWLVVTVDYHS